MGFLHEFNVVSQVRKYVVCLELKGGSAYQGIPMSLMNHFLVCRLFLPLIKATQDKYFHVVLTF